MRVVVVGGGITGLAAAWEAVRLGADVTLLEASDRFGGKLLTVPFAGRPVDVGADAFLVRRPEGVVLARELGLEDRLVHPSASQVWMWARGALRPMPAETVFGVPSRVGAVARTGVLPPAAVARAALEPLLARTRGLPSVGEPTPSAHEPSVADVVGAAFGRAVVDDLVEPLLGGIYAGRADRLGLWSAAPALAAPLANGASAGSLTRALRDQRRLADPTAPVFATFADGMGTLVDALVAALEDAGAMLHRALTVLPLQRSGDRFVVPAAAGRAAVGGRTSQGDEVRTHAVTPPPGAADGPEHDDLGAGGADGDARHDLVADAVVVTVPATAASALVSGLAASASEGLRRIRYADVATISLAYRREDVADVPEGSGVLVPASSGLLVKAATWGWQKWGHQDAGDVVTLRASVGRIDDRRALDRHDAAALLARVDGEVRAMTGIRGAAVARRLTTWSQGLPQYEPGHRSRVAAIHASVADVPGLAVAGAALDGVGVAPCIAQGRAAARRALGSTP